MNMKQKIACAILFLGMICVTGCISPKTDVANNTELINKYFTLYVAATNSSNLHIDAMLKTYSAMISHGPPYTWTEALNQKSKYEQQATTLWISSNYIAKATDEEGRIFDGFITDMISIHYTSPPRMFGFMVGDLSAAYIFKMNDYFLQR